LLPVTNAMRATNSVRFGSKSLNWDVLIEPNVVQHLMAHRQLGNTSPEVGGQLFGTFEKDRVRVILATGPRDADRKSRFSFFPNRNKENAEIKKSFETGLHYVGDWHTHPERKPSPSSTDLESMKDCFRKSKHQMSHFVMVIVGEDESPGHWWASAHDAKTVVRMKPQIAGPSRYPQIAPKA